MHYATLYGMHTTIDRAGRVVIPAGLRKRAGLTAGCPLRVAYEDGVIVIERDAPAPQLVRHKGRLLVRPQARPAEPVSLAGLVEEERSRWPV
jgi:AbrB family looped-hinge helix DNA binding protein